MASGPITSWNQWGNSGNSDRLYILRGSKINADGDCSHELKRCFLLERKAMTKLDSILKSRDITLPTKVCLVTVMVFPVVMYGCENWTIKKAECWRIDAFELWCWRKLVRVLWTTRRSKQSVLKEINPEYSLEGLMLNLKLQYLATWCKNWLIGKDPDAGKDWSQEEKRTTEYKMIKRHPQLNGHEFEQVPGVGDGQGSLACCSPWSCKELEMTEWLNWTDMVHIILFLHVPVYHCISVTGIKNNWNKQFQA